MILTVPGDKSITQRALILAGLAQGTSRMAGLLPSADPRSTAGALRALGVRIPELPDDGGEVVVAGRGLRGLVPPAEPLDLGNSGTGARLLLGVLAGQPFSATVTGDASLRGRPMRRVTGPLELMGARFQEEGEPGRLPVRVHGGGLQDLSYDLPVASAQVKSALLLAGLISGSFVLLTEPGRSRDHTERMLAAAGASVLTHAGERGWHVELRAPPEALQAVDVFVPGDFSSAAFHLVLGLLAGAGPELIVDDVGVNPTRTGLLHVLRRMGADLHVDEREGKGGEPVATVRVTPSSLKATEVGADEIPATLDEIPILAAAAARAEGVTRITGAGELRVKETDRIAALAHNLRAIGVRVEELEDGLEIEGSDHPLRGTVDSRDDHRIAMAFGVLGALPGNRIRVRDPDVVEVSYPGFWDVLDRIKEARDRRTWGGAGAAGTAAGAEAEAGAEAARGGSGPQVGGRSPAEADGGSGRTLVTLDGPAASGKSTTAREVARRLGWRYLDSGALYRGLTHALLADGVGPEGWGRLAEADLDVLGVEVRPGREGVDILHRGRRLDAELRTDEVTQHVSRLAAIPAVRHWLLEAQRAAGRYGRLVADGRDMGSVVFPQAATKVFLQADPLERARRRLSDKGVRTPGEGDLESEVRRLEDRDRLDREREASPLRVPDGALVLDTTDLTFEEQVERIVEEARRNAGPPAGGTTDSRP